MNKPSEHVTPNTDLKQCAREPIHMIGHVQSHGMLFVLSEPDLVIQQASTNVDLFLGMSLDTVLGVSLETILGTQQFEAICAQLRNNDTEEPNPLRVTIGTNPIQMNCVWHRQDGVLIVEFEIRAKTYSSKELNIAAHFRSLLSRMDQASTIVDMANVATTDVQKLSGFDRVMIYQFDEAWAGEVIAETICSASESYLNHHFPASDIPAQARQMFLINPSRVISDATSTSIPITPRINPLTNRALDLTRSSLRSAAQIHIQYLINMSVQASMTISIVVKGQLWGMIACHHAVPHLVEYSTRSACELIGHLLASQIALRINSTDLQTRLTSRNLLETYMARIESSTSITNSQLLEGTRLIELFDADGLVLQIDGAFTSQGISIEKDLLVPIITNLHEMSSQGIAHSNMLGVLDSDVEYTSSIRGALYLALDDSGSNYLLFLRRELISTVTWAGNPNKTLSTDTYGMLHPRTSFAAWQETVRGTSRPWSNVELENATMLRNQLIRLRETHKKHESSKLARYLADHDALTGLFNRHAINLKLEKCIQNAIASKSSFTILFIDLDNFKTFNDTLGHLAGDQILKIVATRMQHQVRGHDIVGRLGGDEFIIIMLGLSEEDSSRAITRIGHAIAEPLNLTKNDTLPNITASIGISIYPVDGSNAEELLKSSDTAMYKAKHKGGNSFEFFVREPS